MKNESFGESCVRTICVTPFEWERYFMSWKYFPINELSLKIDCKIFFIHQFFFVKYLWETNRKTFFGGYFSKTNTGKYKHFPVKYLT